MEDLNQLYFDQQIALIHAASSSNPVHRRRHNRTAKAIAVRIDRFRGTRVPIVMAIAA